MWTRRRKRPSVAWLPILPIANGAQGNEDYTNVFDSAIAVNAAGNITTNTHLITFDQPPSGTTAASSTGLTLADFQQTGYRLRRIVGKVFVASRQTTAPAVNRPELAIVTAGFIVLRVDDQTGAPLAGASAPYSPQLADNIRDPWIWRRTWALSDNFAQPAAESPSSNFPQTNAEYGSVQDGPHLDQKTARIIMPEERLVFVLSTYTPTPTGADPGAIDYVVDVRVLASMRRATNRRNASR